MEECWEICLTHEVDQWLNDTEKSDPASSRVGAG